MKDEIIVDFNALDRIVKKLNTASSDLQSAMSILSSASLSQSGGAYTNLGTVRTSLKSVGGVVAASTAAQAVSNYGAAIRRLSARSRSLASGVKSASSMFGKAERRSFSSSTFSAVVKDWSICGGEEDGGSSFDWSKFKWKTSDWLKLLKKFGLNGAIASGVLSLVNDCVSGEFSLKTILSFLKASADVTGKIAKGFKENSFDWLGLAKTDSKGILESLGDQIKKYKVGENATSAEKVAVAAKWVGSVLTVATTAYDNFTDTTENNSVGRKIAETIGESAVKIGGGMLIAAGVGALLGGAPAVVVGGATVLVTWGINKVFEAATGKNASEFISDFVLDNAPKAVSWVKEKVGSAVSTTGKKISGWWNSVTRQPAMSGAW